MPEAPMPAAPASNADYILLESRLKTLLPETYQECYEDVQPVSMGSAGLVFAPNGRVAWDEIWGSFCDLAMAGGPPHRGTLLQPATAADIDQNLPLPPGRRRTLPRHRARHQPRRRALRPPRLAPHRLPQHRHGWLA